ncbi:MAG: hypothetical protein HYZ24_00240 [Chloroflexi bacterium]|jgi:hypothetical protein|nr:hypothetical protein [Chloroflexota bacterium]
MTHRHFKYESLLYALALLIALSIRLTQLGAMPLTDAEAAPALQALRISQSQDPALSPHPFYILSTSVLFLLYGGGTNFLARLIPALIGGLFVLAPLLFDDRLKPRPSLILAFFLALDPGLVAISRQAASPILALTFLAFTAGFVNKNRPTLAAVTAALALLSGPSAWFGLLLFLIALAFSRFFLPKPSEETTDEKTSHLQPSTFNLQLSTFIPFILTLLLAGTLFLTVPGGIGAAFSSIPAFIASWTSTSEASQGMLFISLLVYQPFALLLSIIALIRGWAQGLRKIIFLSVWLLISLLFIVFHPARQMADLVWALIPLNALASLELARHISTYLEERREIAGVALLTLFIWVFAWLGMAGINFLPLNTPDYNLRIWMLAGSFLLLIVSLILVAAGWSIRIARIGGVWGMAIGLGALSLGGLFGSAGLRGMNAPELWWLPGIPSQADLVRETVSQVSELGRGNDNSATVAILGIDSPALEWALRENSAQTLEALDEISPPDIVITPYESNPISLESAYRGQDFIWRRTPIWAYADAAAWLRWVSLREMPQSQELIILWAKNDLFLDE